MEDQQQDNGERLAAYPADHPQARLSILDIMRPDAAGVLRTAINGHTAEELEAREGHAIRVMTWRAWRDEAAAAQAAVPAMWQPSTREKFYEMLEVLPPIAWRGGSFLVGEPYDHDFATGKARYQGFREYGSEFHRTYAATSRPVTVAELEANRYMPTGREWRKEGVTE